MTDDQYQQALKAAGEWRYLTVLLSLPMTDRDDLWLWNRATGKSQLDKWLMWRYDIDESMARTISNHADVPYRCGDGHVTWCGKAPAPTLEQYPELTVKNVLRAAVEGWNWYGNLVR